MKHKHHIIPRHMGGSDDPSNLVMLTVEEHAMAHKLLWETHGKIQDKIAWMCLSGQIDNSEAIRLAGISANLGKVVSEETRKKMSISRKGQKRTVETKTNISNALKDKQKTAQHKMNLMGKRPHVNQSGSNNNNAKSLKTPYGIFGSISECAIFLHTMNGKNDKANRYIISKNMKNDATNWSII